MHIKKRELPDGEKETFNSRCAVKNHLKELYALSEISAFRRSWHKEECKKVFTHQRVAQTVL